MSARPPTPKPSASLEDWLLAAGVVTAVLFVVPSILVTWLAAGAAIATGRVQRRHVAIAAPLAALPVVAIGPPQLLEAARAALGAFPGVPSTVTLSWALLGALVALLGRLLVVTLPIGVPVGLAVAVIRPPVGRELEPEWTPAAKQQAIRGERKAQRRADRRAAKPDVRRSDALAIAISGDLPNDWRRGKTIILPERAAKLPRLLVGRPNAGKSVEIARETYLAGRLADQPVIIDCKGEPGYAADLIDAYQEGWADGRHPGVPTVHLWPDEPLNGWVSEPDGPAVITNRLLGCWEFDLASLWYREVVSLALRLGLHAPGDPVKSSLDLIYRMDEGVLARFWEQRPDQAALVRRLQGKNKMDDVSIRVANLMGALGGLLDGDRAIGQSDLTILSLPTMAAEHDAASILRVVMGDLAHYVSRRKPPGRRLRIVVDEFSAIAGGRLQAIHLAERGRSAGVSTLLSVQSNRGLGTDEEADRLIGAAGPVLLFATAEPERILKLAGTIQHPEVAWQLEDGRPTGRGTATQRAAYRIDANQVRALEPGQAFILSAGRAELVKIIEPPTSGIILPPWRRLLPVPRRPKELPRP